MKVNSNKTTPLCMYASKRNVTSFIKNNNMRVKSEKILKFNFVEQPSVEGHIKVLSKKVHQRVW